MLVHRPPLSVAFAPRSTRRRLAPIGNATAVAAQLDAGRGRVPVSRDRAVMNPRLSIEHLSDLMRCTTGRLARVRPATNPEAFGTNFLAAAKSIGTTAG